MNMIEESNMTRRIKVKISNILKAKDKKFIDYIYESLTDDLLGNKSASHFFFDKNPDEFLFEFTTKICKEGDVAWTLMRESLYLIAETEPNVAITITDIEEEGTGVIFTMGKLIK